MAVAPEEIVGYLSGADSNNGNQTQTANSLGNYRSSTLFSNNSPGNIYTRIRALEALNGVIRYRNLFYRNEDPEGDDFEDGRVWILNQPSNPGVSVAIAIEMPSPVSTGNVQTIIDEFTSPIGLTFSAPTSYETGIVLPIIGYGEMFSIWFELTVAEETTLQNNVSFNYIIGGATLA